MRAILTFHSIDDKPSVISYSPDFFALLLQVGGNWNNIAKLENQIAGLEKRLGLMISSRRTTEKQGPEEMLPYGVDVVALDQPGIVHNLANFFSQRQDCLPATMPALAFHSHNLRHHVLLLYYFLH